MEEILDDNQTNAFQKAVETVYKNQMSSPIAQEARNNYTDQNVKQQASKDIQNFWANNTVSGDSRYAFGTPLEGGSGKPSLVGKNYNVDELYATLSSGETVKRLETYTPGVDNLEAAAKNQSNWDKWTNGATKALAQFGTGVVGGTIGTVYGIGEWINQGRFAATYDNDLQNYLDNWNEKLKYELPNLKTKQEQKADYLDKLGTANFWADDFLGGLSFTASAIASEAIWDVATGGAGLATTGARFGKYFGKIDDITRAVGKARSAVVKPLTDATSSVLKATRVGGKIGEGANLLRSVYTGAGYEAGFEARAYMREMRANFEADWTKRHGTPPTEEDKAEFERNLESSANGLYAFNVGVVGLSNVAMFGSLVGVTVPKVAKLEKWFDKSVFGSGVNVLEGGAIEAVKATKLQRAIRPIYTLGKGAIMEGAFEEGFQAVGSNTAKNFMYDGYDKKFANTSYDISKGVGNAFSKVYTTKEGLEEVYTGMLIGAFTGSAIGLAQKKSFTPDFTDSDKRAKMIEEEFGQNAKYSSKAVVETMAMNNRILASKQAEENANKRGDLLGGQLSRNSTIFSQLRRADVLDYFDETVDSTLKNIDLIDEQSLMKEHGLTEDQAKDLKESMKAEYQSQAQSFKEANDFANYYVGNRISKQEIAEIEQHLIEKKGYTPEKAAEEAKNITSDMLSQSLAYEMFQGKVAHDFSDEMLKAFQNETQNIFGSLNTQRAFNISDVLNKSSEETQAKADQTKNELERATNEFKTIEDKYRQVENILLKATSVEERQSIAAQLGDLQLEKETKQTELDRLNNEFNVLYNAAQIENPLKSSTEEFLTNDDILGVDKSIASTLEAINKYEKTNPIQAARLKKLLLEYGKSLGAYKKYSERTQQILTEGVGLRGKRNILTELIKDKTPTEATVKMIQGLMDTHFEYADFQKESLETVAKDLQTLTSQSEAETTDDIPAVVMQSNPNQVEIDRLEEEKVQKEQDIQLSDNEELKTRLNDEIKVINSRISKLKREGASIQAKNFIIAQIQNHPYFFRQIQGDYQQAMPTKEEIDEYYDLADKDLVEQQPLTPEELARFEALNIKMANWQLLEAVGAEGTSIADMIQQDILSNEDVKEKKESEELTQDDVDKVIDNTTDKEVTKRPMSVLQTIQHAFVRQYDNDYYISHITPKKFLELIGQNKVEIYAIKKDKNNVEKIDGEVIKTNAQSINDLIKPNMVISFGNSKVYVTEGMTLKVKNSDFDSYNLKSRFTKSGYSMLFDPVTGKPMESDFKGIDYSSQEIYNLNRGKALIIKVDRNNEYNQKLSEDEWEKNLRIDLYDEQGSKVGTLKAQQSTDVENIDEAFLNIRQKATVAFKEGQDLIEVGTVEVDHIFLGSPNIQLDDNNRERMFNIIPEQVVSYGIWDNGKLKGKEKIPGVRTDLLKGINKVLPIVIMKEGDTLVAYPVSLVKTDSMMGDQIVNSGFSPAQTVIKLKEALLKDGQKPMSLYFYSNENNNMFNEDGSNTEEYQNVIDAVNKIQLKVDYKTEWFKPEHTKDKLVNEAQINIDMNQPKLLSPKIAININSFTESNLPNTITEEEITEIATKLNSLLSGNASKVRVQPNNEVKILSGNSWNALEGEYKYITHPVSGDSIFVQKFGTKNKNLYNSLLKMDEVELQNKIDEIRKGNLGNVFVKSSDDLNKVNEDILSIEEAQAKLGSSEKLIKKYKGLFRNYSKFDEVTPMSVC